MNFKGLYEHERKGKRLTCFEYSIYHICLWTSTVKYYFWCFGFGLG